MATINGGFSFLLSPIVSFLILLSESSETMHMASEGFLFFFLFHVLFLFIVQRIIQVLPCPVFDPIRVVPSDQQLRLLVVVVGYIGSRPH